jgi:integrase
MELKMDKIEQKIVVPTLAEVVARCQNDANLSPKRRRDLVSALNRMVELTGVDPRTTPASMPVLRPLLSKVRPARHGLAAKTWANIRTNVCAAIVHPTPRQRQHDPEWTRLRKSLPSVGERDSLSRFISFCEDNDVPPTAVSDAVFDRFVAEIETSANLSNPYHVHRRSCRLWNKAAATVAGWPPIQVKLPHYRKPRQSLPLACYPASLQEDVQAYLNYLRRGSDRFSRGVIRQKRLAESTVRQRTVQIVLALSALVAAGWDPASITSLACLVDPDAFETVLRHYLRDDTDETPRPYAHNLAVTLLTLARRWVKIEAGTLQILRKLKSDLGSQPEFTAKNDNLLLLLEDPRIRAELLLLPEELEARAKRASAKQAPSLMAFAVALGILRIAPLRIGNLAALRVEGDLVRPGGPRSLWYVDIPAAEVKNGVRLVHELKFVTPIIDRYLKKYRPLIAPPGNPYLFPVGAKSKRPIDLSLQIHRVIADCIGIDMTPHQYRHFAGKILKEHSPDSFATFSQLLGHKSLQTAHKFYSRVDTLSAGRHFDAILEIELGKARSYRRK